MSIEERERLLLLWSTVLAARRALDFGLLRDTDLDERVELLDEELRKLATDIARKVGI